MLGADEVSYDIGKIRNIVLDENIFTAELHIKVYAGELCIPWLNKRDARQLKDMMMRVMSGKPAGGVIGEVAG